MRTGRYGVDVKARKEPTSASARVFGPTSERAGSILGPVVLTASVFDSATACVRGGRIGDALVSRLLGLAMNRSAVTAPAISFENLTLGYDRHPVVHHVKGRIEQGALLAIVGSNGAGKSTLLKAIVGELKPLTGNIDLHGASKQDVAYLPQVIDIDRSFPISVFDCVAMGLWRDIGASGGVGRSDQVRVAKALEAVHLTGLETRPVGALSGGQFQRVLFARLLLQEAKIILLDEPFRAVDAKTIDDLTGLIGRWHAEGRTVVAVLHDIELVRHHFSETLLLAREVLAWGDTASVLDPVNLDRSREFSENADPSARICHRDEARETA